MAVAPLNQTFSLASLPTATKTVYLDFNGHVASGAAAAAWASADPIATPPFSLDGDPSFNEAELTTIQNVWARVAEDFAPFQVNVTTREPLAGDLANAGGADQRWGIRIVIGDGAANPSATAGGVAILGSFTAADDIPCFVNTGKNTSDAYVATVASHEAGHTLGLVHHGVTGGEEYHPGHGSGRTSWGPIMGAPYDRNVTQWSLHDGEDDLATIAGGANGFGYRVDDRGDTIARSTPLVRPVGLTLQRGVGVIERNTDVDFFSFTVASGPVDLHVRPLDVISSTEFTGANLDVGAVLYSADGRVVAEMRPSNRLDARFNGTLPGGRYFVKVFGTGNGDPLVDGYTNYGSLGQYTVDVSQATPPPADPPLVAVTGPAVVFEGTGRNTTASFTISLSKRSASAVTVQYATRDGSATVGDGDYAAALGEVTFAPGELRKVVSVVVVGDARQETDETFTFELTSATEATLGRAETAVTIRNDDRFVPRTPVLSVIVPAAGIVEGAGASFTIQLSEPAARNVNVRYATASGTATSGRDFTAVSGVVTFLPGETVKVVTVQTIDDAVGEGDETFAFIVSVPPSSAQVSSPRVVAIIAWSDGGPVRYAMLAGLESGGSAAASGSRVRTSSRFAG